MKYFILLAMTTLSFLISQAQTSSLTVTSQQLVVAWSQAATAADSAQAVMEAQATAADVSPIYAGNYRDWPSWLQASLQQVRKDKLEAAEEVERPSRDGRHRVNRPAKRERIRCGSRKARRTYSGMGYGRPGGRRR